jgi:urea carboxylase
MFKKVLVANRGEIACRVLATLRRLRVASVAVYSDADMNARHVRLADEAVPIGAAPAASSYLVGERIIAAARDTGAEAVHPGYGFLSENADFAAACETAGVRFIGPTPDQIRRFGLKHLARETAQAEGVPLLPGTELLASLEEAHAAAERIGYPVMLKSTAGGGGIGLRVCHDRAALDEAFEAVRRLAKQSFADAGAYVERYLETARHVEVQIFGDGRGGVLALGERDCSTQRRNQKVVEEAPAPGLSDEVRTRLFEYAVKMGRAVGYASAGTVEFVVDARTHDVFFLEVNTRLQVEHGVTEEVTGLDIVEWMVRQAAGELTLPDEAPPVRGAAIEVRLYAEDPSQGFRPSTGRLTAVRLPEQARVEHWIEAGLDVTPHYDPLLAKIVTRGDSRDEALVRMREALARTELHGIETNLAYLRALLDHGPFARGEVHTRLLDGFRFDPVTLDVVDGGTQTTVQDFPGRVGYWAVGVPPSGPMDDLSFRIANRLVGNPVGAPALEITLTGPTLRFNTDAVIALAGADLPATVDGRPIPFARYVEIAAGKTLRLGAMRGSGARTYLAIRGGLDVPAYLGSAATFMLGGFGGHGGRALRAGDVLRLGGTRPVSAPTSIEPGAAVAEAAPAWDIAVLYGPHGAPDFFTAEDIDTFFGTEWRVHYNSDRTGVRLIGPKPRWARPDGGDAGLHPSNIHDNAYAVGTVDYTGDMPILLGPDGPSLGGFVCPATIVRAERWKMGQLKAGDRLRFRRVTEAEASALEAASDALVAGLAHGPRRTMPPAAAEETPILGAISESGERTGVVYRRDGDDYLLVEYGPAHLDLALRFRTHALLQAVERRRLPGILDLTPGIRSLQVHYDPRALPTARLLDALREIEETQPPEREIEVPSRIVHLPLSWEDEATLQAIEKYMRVVRADAPWCPSNIEFIRRINGLESVDEVRRIVFDASYLVLGLGDVYLGAPVATPLDPRHRLVTTKYNPARTWTPENAVGIGGAYLCIYGMEGPGGYQFVGRTVQVWNTHRTTPPFLDGKPWLLRFFDQIRFYPVDGRELLHMRAGFLHGRVPIRIEEDVFRFRDYARFLDENADGIRTFRATQQAAFVAERERWAAAGQDVVHASALERPPEVTEAAIPEGCLAVTSPVAGSLWRVLRAPGESVREGDAVAIVEAMKTEISVLAAGSGVVREVRVAPGSAIQPGQVVAVLEER